MIKSSCPVSEISLTFQRLLEEESPILDLIRNPKGLIRALRDLEALSENLEVKRSISQQIKDFIVTESSGSRYGGKMHMVFSGPPGVGKSTTAKIVARILFHLGYPRPIPIYPPVIEQLGSSASVDLADLVQQVGQLSTQLHEVKTDSPMWTEIGTTCDRIHACCSDLIYQCCPLKEPSSNGSFAPQTIKEYEEDDSSCYVLAGREDFVAMYQGHTLAKTQAFLEEHRGKIIILEEAYMFAMSREDSYGAEALGLINRVMDEEADSYIFIFNGYSDMLDRTIFRVQPGLQRRIQWRYELEPYSYEGLASIFKQQMKTIPMEISQKSLVEFFHRNKESFSAYGGDTERLSRHCHIILSSRAFSQLVDRTSETKQISLTMKILEEAFNEYKKCGVKVDKPPFGMFM